MATPVETGRRITKSWNFGTCQHPLTLDEFLARKSPDFKFFAGSEPWIGDHERVMQAPAARPHAGSPAGAAQRIGRLSGNLHGGRESENDSGQNGDP